MRASQLLAVFAAGVLGAPKYGEFTYTNSTLPNGATSPRYSTKIMYTTIRPHSNQSSEAHGASVATAKVASDWHLTVTRKYKATVAVMEAEKAESTQSLEDNKGNIRATAYARPSLSETSSPMTSCSTSTLPVCTAPVHTIGASSISSSCTPSTQAPSCSKTTTHTSSVYVTSTTITTTVQIGESTSVITTVQVEKSTSVKTNTALEKSTSGIPTTLSTTSVEYLTIPTVLTIKTMSTLIYTSVYSTCVPTSTTQPSSPSTSSTSSTSSKSSTSPSSTLSTTATSSTPIPTTCGTSGIFNILGSSTDMTVPQYAAFSPNTLGKRLAFNQATAANAETFELVKDAAGVCRIQQVGTKNIALVYGNAGNGPVEGLYMFFDSSMVTRGSYSTLLLTCLANANKVVSCLPDVDPTYDSSTVFTADHNVFRLGKGTPTNALTMTLVSMAI